TPNRYLYRIERLLDPGQEALAREIVATYIRLRYDLGSGQRDLLDHLRKMVHAFRP
ncbi:MAG: hypothetical protein GX652_17595, partial [Burkholderiaceae bacterium]|nr:hypothetical protein [Burkholderiaceae bacterium]